MSEFVFKADKQEYDLSQLNIATHNQINTNQKQVKSTNLAAMGK